MAEPKGTYYSPQESGWATVLRPGPNFLGMAQQQQALAARREQLAMQQQAKADAERERQVGKIVADLSKSVPTAFPYQEEVNKKKAELLKQVQDMYLNNTDASEIRFKTANGVQEMLAYANSGKQVYEGILSQTKQLDQKKYKVNEITGLMVDKIIGPEGSIIDPSNVDPRDLSATELVYTSPRPWDYLNQNVVVKDFLKNDKFKETLMEVQRNSDAGRIGRFTTFDKTTNITKAVGPLYDVNPISGEVKLNDPETLIENGVYQLAMNDRDMAAVIEGEIQKLTENRLAPIDGKAKDMLAASVLQDLLVGSTPGPTTIERVNRRVAPTSTGTGGKTTQSEKESQTYAAQEAKWSSDVMNGDVPTLTKAVEYISKEIGLSQEARSGIEEFLGQEGDFVDMQVSPDGTIYARMNNNGRFEYKQVNRERLAGELGKNIYAETYKSTKRHYGTTESGGTTPNQSTKVKTADDL